MGKEIERILGENEWTEEEPTWKKRKRNLSKQLLVTTTGDIAWEKRRRQILHHRRKGSIHDCDDEDLNELRGCIELGFGFNEEDGQTLCNTLPALDLYFAVNRHLTPNPISTPTPTPHSHTHSRFSSSLESPTGTPNSDSWKICSPGYYSL